VPGAAARLADPAFRLALERGEDRAACDALVDAAFGPGRYAKTAERLREGNQARADLCFCAWGEGALVGSVRLWPVRIGGRAGLFLGPIAVERAWRKHGIGAALVEAACAAAAEAGDGLVLLVGDPPFFGPLGFEAVPAGRATLPGPVDPGRVLWRALRAGALDGVAGEVAPSLPPRAGLTQAP